MYDDNEPKSSITCNGKEVAMKSVHVHGKLDGLLLRMKSRQTYTNESEDTLETVYTFPLAWGATLLNLAVEINGKRLNGTMSPSSTRVRMPHVLHRCKVSYQRLPSCKGHWIVCWGLMPHGRRST